LCDSNLKTRVENPFDKSIPMHLFFDTTHNVKNIFNNFQRRRHFSFHDDCEFKVANFEDIIEVFEIEQDKPLKIATKLKKEVFEPSNLQRTSTKLAGAVFHESTITALKLYANDSNTFLDTSLFLAHIKKFWEVLNVRTPFKGKSKRLLSMDPIRSTIDWQFDFFESMRIFFNSWQLAGTSGLSRETFLANKQTVSAMGELALYMLDNVGYEYFLTGKVLSDCLEERFGWYRMKAGGNYFISFKNIVITEKKIKTISLLKFSGFKPKEISQYFAVTSVDSNDIFNIVSLINLDFWPSDDDGFILLYVSGYVARSVSKDCPSCCTILQGDNDLPDIENIALNLFADLNRGGLKKPSSLLFQISSYAWAIFVEVTEKPEIIDLLKISNAKNTLVEVTCQIMQDNEVITISQCESGHNFLKRSLSAFFNCFMKNFCNKFKQKENMERRLGKFSS